VTDTQQITEQTPTEVANNGSNGKNGFSKPAFLKPRVMGVLAVVAVIVMVVGARYWSFAKSHVSTDNAYVTADVVQISPQVSGTVRSVLVKENQQVAKGDLLIVLDDSNYRVMVAQRQADLQAAVAQAKGAGVQVGLTTATGNAQIQQAAGGVAQAQSGIGGAMADEIRTEAGIKGAIAGVHGAEANISTAEASLQAAIANKRRSENAIGAAQAQLQASKAGVKAAQAQYDRAAKDFKRYTELASEGAVTQAALDAATSTADSAEAQLENMQAIVIQKESDLSAAKDQLGASDAAIAQAKAQLSASREQAEAAKENVSQAQAMRSVAQQNVHAAQARSQQAQGLLSQARTAPRQVAVTKTAQAQALAKIQQARAALDAAQLQLSYTRVYAPSEGRISKKSVLVGALVQPGAPLMALVEGNLPSVVANFKETQLRGITPGHTAEFHVDALPGMVFHGHVDSISAATGATFALLPPDNATGNFTKVVQRIPVKIRLDAKHALAGRLRPGMSVVATILTDAAP
jgi:membrane fusion protein (multidrug efflux system)